MITHSSVVPLTDNDNQAVSHVQSVCYFISGEAQTYMDVKKNTMIVCEKSSLQQWNNEFRTKIGPKQ